MTPTEIGALIEERVRSTKDAGQRLEANAHQDDSDRSLIASVVVLGFGGCIVLVLVMVFVGAILNGGWHEAMALAVDLLKSVLLPVVTLILGYYFGRAARG
ncbi:MAG: hypothetical protein NVSMB18_22060 [Acetobacteraceae bacterium]